MKNGEQKKKSVQGFYVTMVVILMMAAVIVAVAGAVAKNTSEPKTETKMQEQTVTDSGDETDEKQKTDKTDKTDKKEDVLGRKKDLDMRGLLTEDEKAPFDDTKTETPDTEKEKTGAEIAQDEKTEVGAKEEPETLPTFTSPVNGEVMKGCSLKVPVFSLTMEDYRTHPGIDICASNGTSVAAAADGVITEIGKEPMMGMTVKVAHSGGAVTVYQNLSADLPEGMAVGKEVKAGDVIGCIGETALAEIAEESHLHFEMTVNGAAVDPSEYITLAKDVSYEE